MPSSPAELQQILTGLLQNDIEGNEMFFECKASRVVVESEEEIPWTLDGEFGGSLSKVEILNQKQALTLMLPEVPIEEMAHQPKDESAATESDFSYMDMEEEIDVSEIYREISEKYKDVWS